MPAVDTLLLDWVLRLEIQTQAMGSQAAHVTKL